MNVNQDGWNNSRGQRNGNDDQCYWEGSFQFMFLGSILSNTNPLKKSLKVKYLTTLCTLFEKSNFCPKIQFWQNSNIFTSFSSKFFLTIFLVKSKLSTAKKSKTTTFSRVFHPPKIDNFLGKLKLNFWTKNEDFEQCVVNDLLKKKRCSQCSLENVGKRAGMN